MKVWYEDGKVKCLSEMCTEACPRFDKCKEIDRKPIIKEVTI